MIRAISFDFYGVMYTNFDWTVINQRIYSDEAKHEEFRQLIKAANDGAIGNETFRHKTAELAADSEYPDSPAVLVDPVVNTALMDYARELRATKQELKLAILSNGGKEHVGGVLQEFQIYDEFDLIATSAELPCYKPEPAAFRYVAETFGIEMAELLHVDDSPRHIEGAEQAGVKGLLYTDMQSLRAAIDSLE
ncbi:MAG: HAD family hydrolase [Candidatus Saccharimonadales bacterium]|nr:HAD family hydrolase [Candidatus Saccharimonadales bacterium]